MGLKCTFEQCQCFAPAPVPARVQALVDLVASRVDLCSNKHNTLPTHAIGVYRGLVAKRGWEALDPTNPLQAEDSSDVPKEAKLLLKLRTDIKKQLPEGNDYEEDEDMEKRKEVCCMTSTAMLAWFHEKLKVRRVNGRTGRWMGGRVDGWIGGRAGAWAGSWR